MILGRGAAQSDAAIIAEYQQFVVDHRLKPGLDRLADVQQAPLVMCRRIGKPISAWTDDDIIALYANRCPGTGSNYTAFLKFLFCYGYRQATLRLLTTLRICFCRQYQTALQAHRRQLEQATQDLGYPPRPSRAGQHLHLLTALLAITAKPLAELTRTDFDAFRDDYQRWYRSVAGHHGRPDSNLTRLERILVHWQVIPPATVVLRDDERLRQLRHPAIHASVQTYIRWCHGKYHTTTRRQRQFAVLHFFLWLQDHQPTVDRLDAVTRAMALAYATYLKRETERGAWAAPYSRELYISIWRFFGFAIDEQVATAPERNPFAVHDIPRKPQALPRYLSDAEVQTVLQYCAHEASLVERTVVMTLLHTGIRACELAALKATDITQLQGRWKLHVHQGKGAKDRVIPLTEQCRAMLQTWQCDGWERTSDYLFSHHGRPWVKGDRVRGIIRALGRKVGIAALTPHRFRHTFAVTLLNYGMRESALQKLMGHASLEMTLEYGRILDRTVEQAFDQAITQIQAGAHSWVPNFFLQQDYTVFAEGDTVSWIKLPAGFCRRNPKLHCESDVKCFLCERFYVTPENLPRLYEMRDRFRHLGLQLKADVVQAKIQLLEQHAGPDVIPLEVIAMHT